MNCDENVKFKKPRPAISLRASKLWGSSIFLRTISAIIRGGFFAFCAHGIGMLVVRSPNSRCLGGSRSKGGRSVEFSSPPFAVFSMAWVKSSLRRLRISILLCSEGLEGCAPPVVNYLFHTISGGKLVCRRGD